MLTLEFLNQNNACEDGIDFCVRNKLIGFPLKRIGEVEGDYNYFIEWLNRRILFGAPNNNCGNSTLPEYKNVIVFRTTHIEEIVSEIPDVLPTDISGSYAVYNQDGLITKMVFVSTNDDSSITTYEYNNNNKHVNSTFECGDIKEITETIYNDRNRIIYEKVTTIDGNTTYEYEYSREFDDHYNCTSETVDDITTTYDVTYWSDGQLKSYQGLTFIPWFEKPEAIE